MMRGTRVGTLLLWLVLAVSIPLLLFTAGTVWRTQSTQRQQQEAALVDQAHDAAQSVDRAFERLQDGLLALAGSSALQQGDMRSFAQELHLLSVRLGGIPITLAMSDGSVRLGNAASQPGVAAVDGPVRQGALAAVQAGKPVITNLLPAVEPAQREVVVAVPVSRAADTTPSFALVAEIDGARLSKFAEVPTPSPTGLVPAGLVIAVRDRDGVIVARSLHPEWYVGGPSRPGFREAVANRRAGMLPARTTLEGMSAISAFSSAQLSGYSVVAALPQKSFGALIRRDLIQTLLIGAVLLVTGLLAAAYLARRLVGALRAVEQGGPGAAPSGLREVDELAARLRAVSEAHEAIENTLRDSESRLRDLIGTLDLAPIMVRELSGTIRFWSRGCTRLYGWSREEAVGQSSHELLRTQHPEPLAQIDSTLLGRGEWKGDLVHQRRDGSRIIAASHKVLRRDLDGRPHMVMESLVDVTALREAQDALRRLNQDLEERVRIEVSAREAAQRRAEHADRIQALGQLAGGIAHDFNNVLQAVAGGAALIARRPHDADGVSRLVRIISDAAARGASITRRMLLLARRGVLKAEPVEVEALLTGMREVFSYTLGAAIDVQMQVAPGLPRLLADKAQLETALVNLGTNARDAMPDGGALRLMAGLEVVTRGVAAPHPAGLPPGIYVRLSVGDDGTGMSGATLARVGEPFFTTKDVGKGTGLGLPMVKGFADQSGGAFAIESEVGEGTTATLWLPIVADDPRVMSGAPAAETRPRLTGRILLVDDDTLVRDTLTEQLEELGHKVLAAACGTDALAILRAREAVDLMITDLSMPGMNGLTLIREAQGLRPSLPAILLTGYAGDAAALEKGGTARSSYLLMRKPATSAVLGARVTAFLERL
jgi:PAS domain S-box-containing protein